jgi:hypothetical protein
MSGRKAFRKIFETRREEANSSGYFTARNSVI